MQRSVLLTVVPLADYPGCIPTEPVSRYLAEALLAEGDSVRVLAEGEQAEGWPEGVEVVEGSVMHPSETPTAFEGVKAFFLAGADPSTVHDALHRAKEGGATQVVNLSSHGPEIEITLPPDYWQWLATEVVVERSGMAWRHVVPSLVMAVTLTNSYPLVGKSWRDLIRSGQPIRRPFAEAKFPFIHEKDLATIISKVLQGQAFNGRKLHISGRLISDLERVQTLREVLGRDIAFEPLSRTQAVRDYRAQGLTDDAIDYVLQTSEWFAEHPQEVHLEAERILGRPLLSYAQWVEEHEPYFS